MADNEERLKEVLRGLDGLIMLSEWELTLAKDLRLKAEGLVAKRQAGNALGGSKQE